MAFKASDRQRIIDDYLSKSGANMFTPSEFVDWLSGQPDHEAYPWFFGKGDAHAAREHRIAMARQMASGLRITITTKEAKQNVVSVVTREIPAYVSPVSGRKTGGGYEPTDPRDQSHIAEIRRQGCSALRGWLSRYRGAFEHAGVDLSAIEEIASSEDGTVSKSA